MHWARLVLGVATGFVLTTSLAPLFALVGAGGQGSDATAVLSPHHVELLGHSLAVGVLTAALATLLGVPVAWALRDARGRWRAGLTLGMALPLVLPPFVSAVAWIEVLNGGGGPPYSAHGILTSLGLGEPVVGALEASWVLALSGYPCVAAPAFAALARRSSALEEDALMVAEAGVVARVLHWPQTAVSALLGGGLVFLLALNDFSVTDLFQCATYPRAVFMEFRLSGEAGSALRAAWPVLLMLGCGVCGLAVLTRRWVWDFEVCDEASSAVRTLHPAVQAFAAFVLLLSLGLPGLSLLWNSAVPAAWRNLSVTVLGEQVWHSVQVAAQAATMCVLAAFIVALAAERVWPRLRWVLLLPSVLAFAVPAPLLAVGMIALTGRSGVRDTFLPLALANAIRWLPLALLAVVTVLRLAERTVEDSARVEGESDLRAPLRMTLLPSARGLVSTWLLVFALSLGEVGLASLLYPPGGQTLAVAVFDAMHYAHEPEVAVMCLVLVGITALAATAAILPFAAFTLSRRRQREALQ